MRAEAAFSATNATTATASTVLTFLSTARGVGGSGAELASKKPVFLKTKATISNLKLVSLH